MGRVDKGINCSVSGCGNQAERSMSGTKASMAPDLGLAAARGSTSAGIIIKSGKRLPRKREKTKGQDGLRCKTFLT